MYWSCNSLHNPDELKIVVIDNAGFHSLKDYDIPENIEPLRIPPYSPELNPYEKMWAYIKQSYKNKLFKSLKDIQEWLANFISKNIKDTIVKSITRHNLYVDNFNAQFNS